MESLGAILKAERESRNLTLKNVSESTKIMEHLLKAIEDDQYELLASPVYAKGFLEAYARYLGLDPKEVLVHYQRHLEGVALSKRTGGEGRKNSTKKRVRLRRFLILAMVLILAALAFYLSVKPSYRPLPSFGRREPSINPSPSKPSPSPDQKEEHPPRTGLPEKSENP